VASAPSARKKVCALVAPASGTFGRSTRELGDGDISSQSPMPYFFLVAGFILFTVAAALGTALTWFYRPLRPVFPLTWRAWLWGTVGFVLANALLIGAVALLLGAEVSPAPQYANVVGGVGVAALVIGPFVASGAGVVMGVLFGCYLGWRVATRVQRAAA
jgi:MFS family permease